MKSALRENLWEKLVILLYSFSKIYISLFLFFEGNFNVTQTNI